ncbi:hypothetical protein EBI_24019, partial [Enterocytozoon bieneusi H348]
DHRIETWSGALMLYHPKYISSNSSNYIFALADHIVHIISQVYDAGVNSVIED